MSRASHLQTAVLLIDAQSSFIEGLHGSPEPLLLRLERLLLFAQLLELPVIATLERPVEQKGELPLRLRDALPGDALCFQKSAFDCMAEADIRAAIGGLGRGTIAIAGSETDVCVLQSALGLRAAGYEVHLLEDCTFSSAAFVEPALARLRAAGVVPTTLKSFCYELTAVIQAAWPQVWRERLARRPELFPPLEELPPRD